MGDRWPMDLGPRKNSQVRPIHIHFGRPPLDRHALAFPVDPGDGVRSEWRTRRGPRDLGCVRSCGSRELEHSRSPLAFLVCIGLLDTRLGGYEPPRSLASGAFFALVDRGILGGTPLG
jgi:hypothetical protein